MVEHASRWELDGGEMRLYFPPESRALAEMLQARDPMEKLRTVLTQWWASRCACVLNLILAEAAALATQSELRARFEEDPIVRAMLERFGGQNFGSEAASEE